VSAEADGVLDAAALERLSSSVGEEFVAELVELFLGDAPTQLSALRTAIEGGDAEAARRAAHTLKSNGATFGADAFAESCRLLEDRAKAGDLAGAGALLARVEAGYPEVAAALAALGRDASP
jgi:HPt (histidine-containing phosphotransfer) domain-containing protein